MFHRLSNNKIAAVTPAGNQAAAEMARCEANTFRGGRCLLWITQFYDELICDGVYQYTYGAGCTCMA